MHKLSRQVRFSINPFLSGMQEGNNSYASKPCGEGFSLYFGLWVDLVSELDEATGFVVNVVDIDKAVRQNAVPIFRDRITGHYSEGQHVSLEELSGILKRTWSELSDKFGKARLDRITLDLNPFRKLTIKSERCEMVYFSEKFEFAATHKLWNNDFSEEDNYRFFGKCANPNGHGHNYVVEVTVKKDIADDNFLIGQFGRIVDEEFISKVDHKNLNVDVPIFGVKNPTVENISVFAWDCLKDKFPFASIECVTVWESDKTFCSYDGQSEAV